MALSITDTRSFPLEVERKVIQITVLMRRRLNSVHSPSPIGWLSAYRILGDREEPVQSNQEKNGCSPVGIINGPEPTECVWSIAIEALVYQILFLLAVVAMLLWSRGSA